MAKSEKKIDENEVTEVTVRTADETSNPVPNDAEANDPPLRTNRPDVPIAASLAAGAGAHEPRVLDKEIDGVAVDKDGIDRDGRFHGQP